MLYVLFVYVNKVNKFEIDNLLPFKVGGKQEECDILNRDLSHILDQEEKLNSIMEVIQNLIDKTNGLDVPEVLNPSCSTDIDVGIHAYFIQRLSVKTIEKHIRYKKFMESHDVPVCFNPPDYKNFTKHMRFREINNTGYYALKHEKQAMLMYANAFGVSDVFKKYKLPKEPDKSNNYDIPFPYVVSKFSKFQYFPNIKSYNNKLFQTIHFHNWMVGFRAPSELAIMKLDDVNIDYEGNGTLSIVQPKRHGTIRKITLPKAILSSSVHKSFKNYIDNIRSKVVNQFSNDFLYLQEDGKPFTIEHLGNKLSETGKMIYSDYHPYMARHWCAIAKLIETKVNTGSFDYFFVNRWMGHKGIQTTMDYVAPASDYYYIYPCNWYSHALKSYKIGKHDFPNRLKNRALLGNVSPVNVNGLVEIYRNQREKNFLTECDFWRCWEFLIFLLKDFLIWRCFIASKI